MCRAGEGDKSALARRIALLEEAVASKERCVCWNTYPVESRYGLARYCMRPVDVGLFRITLPIVNPPPSHRCMRSTQRVSALA